MVIEKLLGSGGTGIPNWFNAQLTAIIGVNKDVIIKMLVDEVGTKYHRNIHHHLMRTHVIFSIRLIRIITLKNTSNNTEDDCAEASSLRDGSH